MIIPKRKSKYREKDSSEKFHRKRTASKYYRKQKFKDNKFHKKGKSKSTGKSTPKASGKCFNYGKRGHFRKECRNKAKSLINTLVSDQTNKEEIFKLLELDHSNSESSSSSSDHEIHQIYQSFSEPSRASSSTSSGLDVGMACKDSCCRKKTINVLSKHEELILDIIEQIEDLAIKAKDLVNSIEPYLGKPVNPNQGFRNLKLIWKKSTIGLPNPRKKLQSMTFKKKSRKPSLRLEP